MNTARSSQCIFCAFTRSVRGLRPARRKLHSSPVQYKKKSTSTPAPVDAHAAVKEFDIGEEGRKYRGIDKEKWSKYYSPEQVAAIEEASQIIEPGRFEEGQGGDRADPWSVNYFDDFTKIDPVVDKPVRAPWKNLDSNQRMKTSDELTEDFYNLMQNMPDTEEGPDDFFTKFDKNIRLTVGKEEAERNPRSALAPEIPKKEMEDEAVVKKAKQQGPKRTDGQEETPALLRLMQMTGYDRSQLSAIRVKSVISHSVVNQTRLGKIRKTYILSVAGNGKGLLGIGEGKSLEASDARLQSQYRAIRNMQPVLRYEGRTIFGDVKGKVSATELELFARPPGFGLRCQQYIWEMCKCAGISDLAARVTRSRNPMNTVKATMQALLSQKDPEDIARARGKKLVDVRKVYYAGQL